MRQIVTSYYVVASMMGESVASIASCFVVSLSFGEVICTLYESCQNKLTQDRKRQLPSQDAPTILILEHTWKETPLPPNRSHCVSFYASCPSLLPNVSSFSHINHESLKYHPDKCHLLRFAFAPILSSQIFLLRIVTIAVCVN
jgi:hypothetical protein